MNCSLNVGVVGGGTLMVSRSCDVFRSEMAIKM